jgi:hypothetical protein
MKATIVAVLGMLIKYSALGLSFARWDAAKPSRWKSPELSRSALDEFIQCPRCLACVVGLQLKGFRDASR